MDNKDKEFSQHIDDMVDKYLKEKDDEIKNIRKNNYTAQSPKDIVDIMNKVAK